MKENEFLPFAKPDIGDEEINEVVDSLKSGWVTTGPKTKIFEDNFAKLIGDEIMAIAVNSATSGLHLALESIGIQPGDEVIVPSYTFTATAEVVRYLGAHPKFIDVEATSLNIDPAKIEEAITPKTRAIIPVHFGGLACDMNRILSIAKDYNLKVIEDAAHALPTTYNNKIIGGLESDATVFSFYATKTITTGEGGMIVTRNNKIYERCKLMRLHGISCDAYNRYNSKNANWFYEVIEPGFKYNMNDIAASIGIHQLNKAFDFQRKREQIAEMYSKELKSLPVVLPSPPKNSDKHAWHLYVIRLEDDLSIERDEVIQNMYEKGIGCSVHFIPLHIQPYWKNKYKLTPESCPVSLKEYSKCISLPIYTKMTENDVERVISTLRTVLA